LAHDKVLDIVTNAQASYQGLQHLSFNFRTKFEQMTNQLQKISTKLVFQQDSIAKETKKGLQAVSTLTENSIKTIQDTTDAGMTLINSKWFQFSGGEFDSFKTKIHDTMREFENQLSTTNTDFTEWLTNTTKELEALLATKNALQQTSSTSSVSQIWKQKPDRPSKLFPHANIDQIWNTSTQTTNPKPCAQEQFVDSATPTDDWSYLGPSQDTAINITQLPPLLPGKMYSQVKVQYEGKDASFALYRQLRSAVFQYGILLKPCEEFQKEKSLCPNTHGIITVTALRYNEMKGPLYQLLQSPDIVPMVFEDIRGIITKNGAWGDGYRTLYEIMSRIHPILNPDAQLPPPHSGNFADIHGYYNQFDAYV
jgi:hypothetical protein